MSKVLATAVHLTDEDGVVYSFLPGQMPPKWAAERITNPKAWAEVEEPVVAEKVRTPGVPAKAGKGSSLKAWRDYADKNGFEIDDDATRDDIIVTLASNGIPTE